MKKMVSIFFLFLSLAAASAPLAAADADAAWFVTPKVGISLFTGILGLEAQKGHVALDVGIFPSGGIRYYARPRQHSWFAGLFGSGVGYDNDETKDGVPYTHYSFIEGGVGIGYRWLWRSRWNLEIGATAGYEKERWTNTDAWRTRTSIALTPLATVGYTF